MLQTLITASELKSKGPYKLEDFPDFVESLNSSIIEASNRGVNHIWLACRFSHIQYKSIRKEIELAGYTVTYISDQREGDSVKIEWNI